MGLNNNTQQDIEIWLPVRDYADKYEVSNFGRVRSVSKNKIMRGQPTKGGYLRIRLYKNKKYESRMIHRMVAEAFIPLPDNENKYEVDHKDDNVINNVVENLQWLTHAENLEKSFQRGHQSRPKKEIIQFDKNWNFVNRYESKNEAFRQTHICHIGECAQGIYPTAGGYYWRYIDDMTEEEINGLR